MSLRILTSDVPLPPSVVSGSPTGGIPAWAEETEYALNTLVTSGGSTYICNEAHKSSATFEADEAKWQAVGTAGLTKAEAEELVATEEERAKAAEAERALTSEIAEATPTVEDNDITVPTGGGVVDYVETQAGLLIPESLGTAKGSLIGFSAKGTPVERAAGADNTLLCFDSSQSDGLNVMHRAQISISRPQKPLSSNFLTNDHATTGTGIPVGVKEKMQLFPVDLGWSFEFDRIGCDMTVVGEGAGQVIRLGLYADDGTGTRPTGAAIFDAGTLSALETIGDKLLTIEQKLGPGRFWYAFVLQGTVTKGPTMVTSANPPSGTPYGVPDLANKGYGTLVQSSVSGALPSIGSLSIENNSRPLIGMRVK